MSQSPDNIQPGEGEKVELTQEQYDELVKSKADRAQAEANMAAELADLRKKNRELQQNPPAKPEEVSDAVQKELDKREAEAAKAAQALALERFLGSHPDFSSENDADGSKLAAYQKALSRMSLNGVKTVEEYEQVLEDALRLTDGVAPVARQDFSSTPRVSVSVVGQKTSVQLHPTEAKLIENNFNGDTAAYLKVKAKRPEYVEELLKWVR